MTELKATPGRTPEVIIQEIKALKEELADILEPECPFKMKRTKRHVSIWKCTDEFEIELCRCTNSDAALLILRCLYTAHNIKPGSDLIIATAALAKARGEA